MATQRQYIINEHGRRTAVVLNIREFDTMRKHLEDLEDVLELKHAIREEQELRELRAMQAEERAADRRTKSKT